MSLEDDLFRWHKATAEDEDDLDESPYRVEQTEKLALIRQQAETDLIDKLFGSGPE